MSCCWCCGHLSGLSSKIKATSSLPCNPCSVAGMCICNASMCMCMLLEVQGKACNGIVEDMSVKSLPYLTLTRTHISWDRQHSEKKRNLAARLQNRTTKTACLTKSDDGKKKKTGKLHGQLMQTVGPARHTHTHTHRHRKAHTHIHTHTVNTKSVLTSAAKEPPCDSATGT